MARFNILAIGIVITPICKMSIIYPATAMNLIHKLTVYTCLRTIHTVFCRARIKKILSVLLAKDIKAIRHIFGVSDVITRTIFCIFYECKLAWIIQAFLPKFFFLFFHRFKR